MLLSIGPIVFDLVTNVEQYTREVAEDFARKDVVGARKPFESVGHGDETLSFTGKLFPERLGGGGAFDALMTMMQTASPQLIVRGDGRVFGFYLITNLREQGSYLDGRGVPRMLEVEIKCERCDAPSATSALASLLSLFG